MPLVFRVNPKGEKVVITRLKSCSLFGKGLFTAIML